MGWSDLLGKQLGQYTITEELGRGGSSRVYRAFDRERKKDVAVKVIPNDAEDRVGFIRRFEREVQAVAQLDHHNIVAVFDRGETDEFVYLVMQCVTGGTLRQRCGRPMPVKEAAVAVVQMCQALHHAHQHGIIHRDVKPSNMLVDANDPQYLLLTDFGIAKLLGMRGLTKSGTTIGTPEYMAPEQAEGKDVDHRADVYSLGCVLYETLTGRPPFVGSTAVSVLYQQVHSRPSYLRAFNAEVPREVGRIVEQALAKRPDERFGTAALMAEAIYPYTEGLLPPLPTLDGRIPQIATSGPLSRQIGASGPLLGPLPDSLSSPLSITPITNISGPLIQRESASQPHVSLPSSDELVPPAPETWHGLGAEGLDAIFPEDDEAKTHRNAQFEAIENTPTLQEMPPVIRTPSGKLPFAPATNSSIPLPSFRLPSRDTQPLNLPLTANGRLDIEALMAQVEEQQRHLPPVLPASAETYTDEQEAPSLPAISPIGSLAHYNEEQVEQYVMRAQMENDTDELLAQAEPITPRQAVLRASKLASSDGKTRTVWRPPLEELPDSSAAPASATTWNAARRLILLPRNRLYLLSGAAAAAVLIISLVIWGSVSASGLLFANHPQKTPIAHQATATTTALPSPSATATKQPASTATVNSQQVRNNEAAGSFRSVIVSQFADNSCSSGNETTHFGVGQTVYVDLCTSSNPYSGPATVTIRQGGDIFYTLVQGFYLSPASSSFFYRYGIPIGTYDMVVTMPINGHVAVARDIVFTVG